MSIDTLWQSREPIGVDSTVGSPTNNFGDYHADIVASLHKKGNTLQIRCASQNQRNTPAQRAVIAVKHTEMLAHGGDRKSEEIKRSDDPLKTIDEVAKVAGVSRPRKEKSMSRDTLKSLHF